MALLKDCPVRTDWLGVLLSVIFLSIDALNGGVDHSCFPDVVLLLLFLLWSGVGHSCC
jgi:hypothetical protein